MRYAGINPTYQGFYNFCFPLPLSLLLLNLGPVPCQEVMNGDFEYGNTLLKAGSQPPKLLKFYLLDTSHEPLDSQL